MIRRFPIFLLLVAFVGYSAVAQKSSPQAGERKVVQRVVPVYPELARRMDIFGVVKLDVKVSPNGSVKSVEALGGNPILIKAAQDAVVKWKFAAAAEETHEAVQLRFER